MKPRLNVVIALCLAGGATLAVAAPPADRDLDLVVLSDLNGNASAELATLVSEPDSGGITDSFDRNSQIFVRDSLTRTRINRFQLPGGDWHTLELIAVPLGDGSLIGALQQHDDGAIRVMLYEPLTGTLIREISYLDTRRTAIAAAYVPDAGLGVPGLAVLALNWPISPGLSGHSYLAGEEVIIEIRSPSTGLQLQKLYNQYYGKWDYGYDVTPLAITPVEDQNGNGSTELAVLAEVEGYAERNTIAVVTRDTFSGDYLSPYFEGNGAPTMFYTNTRNPIGFVSLPDATGDGQAELAILGRRGKDYRLQLREVMDGSLAANRRVYSDWSPQQVRVLGDVDGNGAAEVAVAAVRPDGRITVDVRDGETQKLTSRINFLTAAFSPRDLEVLPDQSGNGVEELALMGRDTETGDVWIQIRDAATGELLRTLRRP